MTIFVCPKCRTKADGAEGSIQWCYCGGEGKIMRPESPIPPPAPSPETVCPKCEGRGTFTTASPRQASLYICADCGGTGHTTSSPGTALPVRAWRRLSGQALADGMARLNPPPSLDDMDLAPGTAQAPAPPPSDAAFRVCSECQHAEAQHSDRGCVGSDGMGCDCPGWRVVLPGSDGPAPAVRSPDAAFREKLDALEHAAIAAAPGTAPNEAILERARARVAVEAVLQNTVRACKEAQDAWRKRDEEAWEERNKRIAVEESFRRLQAELGVERLNRKEELERIKEAHRAEVRAAAVRGIAAASEAQDQEIDRLRRELDEAKAKAERAERREAEWRVERDAAIEAARLLTEKGRDAFENAIGLVFSRQECDRLRAAHADEHRKRIAAERDRAQDRADKLEDDLTMARANVDGTTDALAKVREALGLKPGDSAVETVVALRAERDRAVAENLRWQGAHAALKLDHQAAESSAEALRTALRDVLPYARAFVVPEAHQRCRDRLIARAEALAALSSSSAPALAEWYEPDGSTTMLPAEEVTRRGKAAAKVIGAARAVNESAFQHEGFGTWEVPDQDISDLCAALAALDAPAPEASFVDALRRFHAPTCATHAGGECDCVTWIRAAARPGLCSRCGSTRIALDRDGTKFGACSLVPGDDGTGGCPDPMYDYNREQASLSEGSTVKGDAKLPANSEGTKP